jgi:ATP-dependent Clp protease ATP-binding subunit ClpX
MVRYEKAIHCSFCGKEKMEVRVMIAGPKAFICDECVDVCVRIVQGTSGKEAVMVRVE